MSKTNLKNCVPSSRPTVLNELRALILNNVETVETRDVRERKKLQAILFIIGWLLQRSLKLYIFFYQNCAGTAHISIFIV